MRIILIYLKLIRNRSGLAYHKHLLKRNKYVYGELELNGAAGGDDAPPARAAPRRPGPPREASPTPAVRGRRSHWPAAAPNQRGGGKPGRGVTSRTERPLGAARRGRAERPPVLAESSFASPGAGGSALRGLPGAIPVGEKLLP